MENVSHFTFVHICFLYFACFFCKKKNNEDEEKNVSRYFRTLFHGCMLVRQKRAKRLGELSIEPNTHTRTQKKNQSKKNTQHTEHSDFRRGKDLLRL